MNEAVTIERGLSAQEVEIMRAVEDAHWWFRALREQVLSVLQSGGANFKLLDAGCGGGGMLARLRERFPAAALTGIDWSERALQLTEERATGAELVRGSVDDLPFADEAFDVVLSLDVIVMRGVDEQASLREMHR